MIICPMKLYLRIPLSLNKKKISSSKLTGDRAMNKIYDRQLLKRERKKDVYLPSISP